MAQFSGAAVGASITASTTNANIIVLTELTAGNIGSVKMFSWGGSDTSLISIVTRWARITNTPATPTAYTVTSSSPGVTPNGSLNTYATAATSAANAGLFQTNWNSQGGGGAITLPLGGEWKVAGGALGTAYNQIGVGNTTGTSTNLAYDITWEE